jgi:hypothetical protein
MNHLRSLARLLGRLALVVIALVTPAIRGYHTSVAPGSSCHPARKEAHADGHEEIAAAPLREDLVATTQAAAGVVHSRQIIDAIGV